MEPVQVRFTLPDFALFFLIGLGFPAGFIALQLTHPVNDTFLTTILTLACFIFLLMPWGAVRFLIRVDAQGIFHREIVTRFIPWDEVNKIRFSRQLRKGLVSHIHIEVQSDRARILMAWREGRMQPILEAIQKRLPDKVQETQSLPLA